MISGKDDEEQRGVSYIRWGRKVCEGNATLVYKGDVGLYIIVIVIIIVGLLDNVSVARGMNLFSVFDYAIHNKSSS